MTAGRVRSPERRRARRVPTRGLVRAHLAVRQTGDLHPLSVRDISVVGLGLTSPSPLPVAQGERLHLLLDFRGESGTPPVRGALLKARVVRRLPDADGWFVGIEIDDLRATPWTSLVTWIETHGTTPRVPPGRDREPYPSR